MILFSTSKKSSLPIHLRYHLTAYLFIAPIVILFGIFRVYPSIQTLAYSFFRVELLRGRFTFIGFENFFDLLSDKIFLKAVVNTLIYVISIVPISAGLALILAVLFNTHFRLKEFFKAVYFAPMVTSTVAAAMVWLWLYNPQFGLFNVILKLFGFPAQPWLMSSHQALPSIIIFSIWKSLGYNLIIYIAGLQAIPDVYYEAARIDGAGSLQQFFKITLPLLTPTTTFLLIYNSILSFQVFDQVFVLTGGGPAYATTVVVLELYQQAFLKYRFGYASAMAMVLFIFLLSITIGQYAISKKKEIVY
jgi:multiple sugar transport system permease protein